MSRRSERLKRACNSAVPSIVASRKKGKLDAEADVQSSRKKRKHPVATVIRADAPLPKRNKQGQLVFADHTNFKPNLTPQEILQLGSFGGTYFRSIKSGVTGKTYKNAHAEFPKDWFDGLDINKQVTSPIYRAEVNRFGVKCGASLEMWEESGWISNLDPYGWFQWYCRFYLGRRCTDDEHQISRQLGIAGPTGRFRNQLIGKIARAGADVNDASISPVIRQTLQHWAYTLTLQDAERYVKAKGLPALPS